MTTREFDPVHVLGCSLSEARDLLRGKRITPGEVESVALKHYDWRGHLHDPDSYWVTVSQAADVLAMSPAVLGELLDSGRVPFLTHASGVRLMRREEVRRIAEQSREPSVPRPRNRRTRVVRNAGVHERRAL